MKKYWEKQKFFNIQASSFGLIPCWELLPDTSNPRVGVSAAGR
jgi:predicted small integral membrane protein